MNIPYTAQERKQFLTNYYMDLEKSRELDYETSINEDAPESVVSELDNLRLKLIEEKDQYRMSTPVIPLSRCPFTNQVVYHSIDIHGLDGLWWDSQVPIRPVDTLPSSFFMLTGSLNPNGDIKKAPIVVKPGPEVPYVVPEILSNSGIKAVISALKIGTHTAYTVFYFIEDWEKAVEPMNTWGANYWSFVNADMEYSYNEYGIFRYDPETEYEENNDDIDEEEETTYTFDFDLKKWIDSEELLWIQPDDPVFKLRKGAPGCPYLNLQGSQDFVTLYDGEIVEEEE